MTTITIEGFLGRDRDIRSTREKTVTREAYDWLIEEWVPYEATIRSREYAVLSVATHEGGWGGKTVWRRVVVWNVDRMENFNVRLLRKGDGVRITGHEEIFQFTGDNGETVELPQIVATRVQRTRVKITRRAA